MDKETIKLRDGRLFTVPSVVAAEYNKLRSDAIKPKGRFKVHIYSEKDGNLKESFSFNSLEGAEKAAKKLKGKVSGKIKVVKLNNATDNKNKKLLQ